MDSTNKLSYKQFSLFKEETLLEYQRFYFNRFPQALQWYYPSWDTKHNIILHAHRHFNEDRFLNTPSLLLCGGDSKNKSYSSEEQYYFSASVYYLCLIPHVIAKIAGEPVRDLFYKASGWPMLSAGLGGLVSPKQWLEESQIAPSKHEAAFYNELLDITLPFHSSEIANFLSGDQTSVDSESYIELCESTNGLINHIISELKSQVESSKQFFIQ